MAALKMMSCHPVLNRASLFVMRMLPLVVW